MRAAVLQGAVVTPAAVRESYPRTCSGYHHHVYWCCPDGAGVFLVHSGIGCLFLCLAHRCCRSSSQVSRGAHAMLSLVRTAWRCVLWAWLFFCDPRELDSVAATGLTSFCSVLQYATAQCPQCFIFGLAHEKRYACKCEVSSWVRSKSGASTTVLCL